MGDRFQSPSGLLGDVVQVLPQPDRLRIAWEDGADLVYEWHTSDGHDLRRVQEAGR